MINELLEQKFEQSPGKLCSVFAVINRYDDSQGYCCLLCSTNIMGHFNLISHAKSKKHKQQHRVFIEKSLTPIPNLGIDYLSKFVRINARMIIIFCRGDLWWHNEIRFSSATKSNQRSRDHRCGIRN